MTDSFPCCGRKAYLDPLYYDETNVRFGHWPRCPSCQKLIGDPKILYAAPKALQEAWKALSVVACREHHAGREGRPLRFELKAGLLVPTFYKGSVKIQPDLEIEQ